jgi:hypothetical protein
MIVLRDGIRNMAFISSKTQLDADAIVDRMII